MHAIVLMFTIFLMNGSTITQSFLETTPAACMADGPALQARALGLGEVRAATWGCFAVEGHEKA